MTNYLYYVAGVDIDDGEEFYGQCISSDIIEAVKMYRVNRYSVYDVSRCKQMPSHLKPELFQIRKPGHREIDFTVRDLFTITGTDYSDGKTSLFRCDVVSPHMSMLLYAYSKLGVVLDTVECLGKESNILSPIFTIRELTRREIVTPSFI